MYKGHEIDELVSSVRNFVAHKDNHRMTTEKPSDKLLLTPESRLTDAQVKAIEVEMQAELQALEAAGIIPKGKASELTLAELEAAMSQLPDDWQPETPAPLAPAADAPVALAAQPATPAPLALDEDALDALIAAKVTEIIDQEAMRALVSKTVQEELAGELGERITRNVRKLVRREINRVMTSRDLTGD